MTIWRLDTIQMCTRSEAPGCISVNASNWMDNFILYTFKKWVNDVKRAYRYVAWTRKIKTITITQRAKKKEMKSDTKRRMATDERRKSPAVNVTTFY